MGREIDDAVVRELAEAFPDVPREILEAATRAYLDKRGRRRHVPVALPVDGSVYAH